LSKKEILENIQGMLDGERPNQISTVNPEFILAARHDEELFYILNNADLAIPDGVGLKFAALVLGRYIYRYTGADLMQDLLKVAESQNKKIAVLNWQNGLSSREDIENILTKKFPNLIFQVLNCERINKPTDELISKIIGFSPSIIFSTFGSPWQEIFIYHSLPKIPSARIGLGIGGGFDFLTGRIKRAPAVFRSLGLEWVWRLIKQPWRFKRIFNAVIVFIYQFISWHYITPFLYRPNVACLVYKKINDQYYFLLLARADNPSHWQLPQGGTDGESLEIAGTRELKEEIGTGRFKPVAAYKNVHKYIWGDKLSKFGPMASQIWGYKGQRQGLFIAEFIGEDSDIKVNYWEFKNWKWVEMEKFVEEVQEIRQESAKKFLKKFQQTIK
jgi:N-acetylglucosaminyldiphosphoundecaprenol N-acetyl-beta-D-mannosaminyltransferase